MKNELILNLSDKINEQRETIKNLYYELKGQVYVKIHCEIFDPEFRKQAKEQGLDILLDTIDEFQAQNENILADLQIRLEDERDEEDCDGCGKSECVCDSDTETLRANQE